MTAKKSQHRSHCIRCGECCLSSSPTLQREDGSLLKRGSIQKRHLVTIRKGEGITDNILENMKPSHQEMIKLKEKKGIGGGCIFFRDHDKSCTIYDHRPLQCAALKCWDTREFMRVYKTPKLLRRDVLEDDIISRLIEEHEKRCSYALLEGLVKEIRTQGETAVEALLDLLRFDYELRPFVAQKLGVDHAEMDFYFGRPLIETIPMFGLKVVHEEDGGFLLTT